VHAYFDLATNISARCHPVIAPAASAIRS